MSIDLATIPDASPPGTTLEIPLNTDPFPYQDLQAQGRYPQQATPDTLPNMLATMAAITNDGSNTGQTLWTDGQHRLLVNTGASASGGLGPQPWDSWADPINAFPISTGYHKISSIAIGIKYLAGLICGIYQDTGQVLSGPGALIVGIGDNSGIVIPLICMTVSNVDATTTARTCTQSQQSLLPIPIDFVALVASDPSAQWISYNSTFTGVTLSYHLIAS